MKRATKLIAVLLAALIVSMVINVQLSRARAPTDVTQTIGPVVVSTGTAIALCSTASLSPGSAISGASGVMVAFCPGALNSGVIWFPTNTTETPTFTLSVGFYNMSIQLSSTIFNGIGCTNQFAQPGNPSFGTPATNIGVFVKPGTAVQFGLSSTTVPSGIYDYCLWYSQPLITGIAAFGISWNP